MTITNSNKSKPKILFIWDKNVVGLDEVSTAVCKFAEHSCTGCEITPYEAGNVSKETLSGVLACVVFSDSACTKIHEQVVIPIVNCERECTLPVLLYLTTQRISRDSHYERIVNAFPSAKTVGHLLAKAVAKKMAQNQSLKSQNIVGFFLPKNAGIECENAFYNSLKGCCTEEDIDKSYTRYVTDSHVTKFENILNQVGEGSIVVCYGFPSIQYNQLLEDLKKRRPWQIITEFNTPDDVKYWSNLSYISFVSPDTGIELFSEISKVLIQTIHSQLNEVYSPTNDTLSKQQSMLRQYLLNQCRFRKTSMGTFHFTEDNDFFGSFRLLHQTNQELIEGLDIPAETITISVKEICQQLNLLVGSFQLEEAWVKFKNKISEIIYKKLQCDDFTIVSERINKLHKSGEPRDSWSFMSSLPNFVGEFFWKNRNSDTNETFSKVIQLSLREPSLEDSSVSRLCIVQPEKSGGDIDFFQYLRLPKKRRRACSFFITESGFNKAISVSSEEVEEFLKKLSNKCDLLDINKHKYAYFIFLKIFNEKHLVEHVFCRFFSQEKLGIVELSALENLASNISHTVFSVAYRHDILKAHIKSAIAAIMSRNMSHNLGSHVVTNAKHQIMELERRQGDDSVKEQLKGVSALLQYLQERQDFIAVIANDEHYPQGPLNFKSAVFDLLAMDGPGRRHSPENRDNRINNYILDNIVRSENIVREGSLADKRGLEGAIKIELELVKIDSSGRATTFKSLDEHHEIGNEFSDITLSINNGLNGRQALLTIIENIIRNAAKHNREALQQLDNNTLLFSIIFKEVGNSYEITICSNKKEFDTVKEFFETNGIISPQDGRLTPVQILREDGGGIVRENKGLKEMLICLAWLKYGEYLDFDSEDSSEISYDTLQNTPWELMDVVGVDNRDYTVYDCNAPNQPDDLSLGYRFRLAKHRIVHLLSPAEFADASKSDDALLDVLPSATIYAVRQSDYNKDPDNKTLASLPRLEVVPDEETEESLKEKTVALFERNIKRRFAPRLAEIGGELPLLRISGEANRDFKDFDARLVVRDELGISADRAWEQEHPGEKFVHYRTHYETRISAAFDKTDRGQHGDARAALDLNPGAIFTEGISGGNFTNTLIRTDIDRFAYCGIVEAALVQIAIVDERIFAKNQGITPKQRDAMRNHPNNPRWEYWEQQGIHILNSDEKGIFDLSGRYVSTGVQPRIIYDFLSIHLGLIDKKTIKGATEKEKLEAALEQFGARYERGHTKLSIHSGRGGMTQMGDEIAFFPLSGIEWALDNCKFVLSEFFHGLKFPPFGTLDPKGTVTVEPLERDKEWGGRKRMIGKYAQDPHAQTQLSGRENATDLSNATSASYSTTLQEAKTNPNCRKVFLVTTHDFNKAYLASAAVDTGLAPGIDTFVSREKIRESAGDLSEHFERITHIDRTIFFYPCAKPRQRVLIAPERHGDFVSHLVGKVLEFLASGGKEQIELHLILHVSDAAQRRPANQYEAENPLIDQIRSRHPGLDSVHTWWFSHDGSGIHGRVLGDNRLFSGAAGTDEKVHTLLLKLAEYAAPGTFSVLPAIARAVPSNTSSSARGAYPFPILRLGADFHLDNRTYLNRLAVWQLSGASDQAALDTVFTAPSDENAFWNPRFSPECCDRRLKTPQPLLVIGSKPLNDFWPEDRRAYYLDSSIWCRYAENEEEAKQIQAQFVRNRELGLYDCNNGKEQMEFSARMLINSRLGEFEGSGHKKIVPVVFPSEGEMAKRTQEIIDEIKAEFARAPIANIPLVWKVLLVDDHAQNELSGGCCSKLAVIKEVLSSLFEIEVCEGNDSVPARSMPVETARPALGDFYRLRIYCVESTEEARERIKLERFDIILLDYLLNKSNYSFDTSVDLMVELQKTSRELKEARGPLELLWFSNVSSFANAIDSRLTAMGIPLVTEEWVMNKGACPINTPELFKHNLLQFMCYQLQKLTALPGQDRVRESGRLITLYDLLCAIYTRGGKIRDKAQQLFRAVLKLKADYDILRKDIEYGLEDEADKHNAAKLAANPLKSEIVHSLFPDIVHYTDSFWDHLTHLVYQTAHGSPQQWPQMMVNFKEIKEVLRRSAKSNNAGMEDLVKAIEGHIIALHNGKENY